MNNKSIKLHPVSKEEVDRILKGEMIELSNAACGSAGCGGCGSCGGSAGSCGGSAGSCGGSAGCGGCGGCGCGSGSGDEQEVTTPYEGDVSAECNTSINGCEIKKGATCSYKVKVKRTIDSYGIVQKSELIYGEVDTSVSFDITPYVTTNGDKTTTHTIKLKGGSAKATGSDGSYSTSVSGYYIEETDGVVNKRERVTIDARVSLKFSVSDNGATPECSVW